LDHPRRIRPEYAEEFRCIGSACEDTCCQGWGVPVDRATYEKYRQLPPGPLRNLIQISCLIAPEISLDAPQLPVVNRSAEPAKSGNVAKFAMIRMTDANQCPLLSDQGLCRIHSECGPEFLSHTCATYPRIIHSSGGITEKALALSCPEAARVVLLNPSLCDSASYDSQITRELLAAAREHRPKTIASPHVVRAPAKTVGSESYSLRPWFWEIRQTVLGIVRDRSFALWQRLFLLGILCRRLDSIAHREVDLWELELSVPSFLREFEAAVDFGTVGNALEAMATLPADVSTQLDFVLQMAGMVLRESNARPRFLECIQSFKAGLGYGPEATMQSLTACYAAAHENFYAPFFERYPYILENYLVNTIVRCQFPLPEPSQPPTAGSQWTPSTDLAREYGLLTAQFTLIKGLLIGVAGCHGEAFCAEHVVHTVQAVSKHFEHHPEFLDQTHALLVECQMDGARGLAILLRNSSAEPRRTVAAENSKSASQKAS
jgi:lysine-N-methylase